MNVDENLERICPRNGRIPIRLKIDSRWPASKLLPPACKVSLEGSTDYEFDPRHHCSWSKNRQYIYGRVTFTPTRFISYARSILMNLNIPVTEKNVRFVFPLCLACIITKLLRSVRLMWLPFLIGHLYSSGIYMANLVVKNEHQKTHMSRWECWIICSENRGRSKKYNSK